eukprot:364268-Chlamydomonas_euryale.AAC.10
MASISALSFCVWSTCTAQRRQVGRAVRRGCSGAPVGRGRGRRAAGEGAWTAHRWGRPQRKAVGEGGQPQARWVASMRSVQPGV